MQEKGRVISVILTVIALVIPLTALLTDADTGPGTRVDPVRDQAKVHFNVTYPNGSPASDIVIEITAYYSHSGSPTTGTTNTSGKVLVNVSYYNWGPCSIVLYDAGKDHFLALQRLIAPNDRVFYDLMLPEHLPYDNVVKGTVKKLDTMTAASGVKVQISGDDMMGRFVEESVHTDVSGSYTLNVPDTTNGYLLGVIEPAPGYEPTSVSVFPDPEMAENLFDLYIRPELVATVPFSFKVLNTTSMEPMEGLNAIARGNPIGTDLEYNYRTFTYDSVEKRFETMLFPGEYSLVWNGPEDPTWNVSYNLESYILVNSTPLDMEIKLDVQSELRPVKLRTWSSADEPVGYCLVDYYHTLYEGDQMTSLVLDGQATPDGWLFFGIPPNKDVKIRAWYWGFREEEFIIPAGPASSPVELNVTLQEGGPYFVPQGDFSFFFKDKVTGVPLPGANFNGYTWDEEGNSYSISGMSLYNGYANNSADAAKYPTIKVTHPLGTAIMRNVTIKEGVKTELTVELDRRTYPGPEFRYSLDIVDPQGQPLPSVYLRIVSDHLGIELGATSDSSGRVTFNTQPSTFQIFPQGSPDYWYGDTQWAGGRELVLSLGGGHLGSMTLYPTRPLTAIEGHVLDSSTMNPLRFIYVNAGSFHPEEGPTRQMGPLFPWMEKLIWGDNDGIRLLYSYHHSDHTGFYRAYGRESVKLRCWSVGYFEYNEEVDLGTRAPMQKDILLDPIPAPTTTLEGTLVNEDGTPEQGMVILFEKDHPGSIFLENYTGIDGKFLFDLHPAEYRIVYGNETLHGETTVVVNETGLTGLILRLVPFSNLNGTVKDAEGNLISGVQISLYHPGSNEGTIMENRTTDLSGSFSFELEKGTYRVDFPGSDTYLGATSGVITLTGWNDVEITLVLLNRTSGTLRGRVTGAGGPLTDGIVGATVWLNDAMDNPIMSATTIALGLYEIEDVPYGIGYSINVTPPSDVMGEPGVKTGYLPSAPKAIDVSTALRTIDLELTYYMLPAPGHFNITHFGPQGTNVLLDEPIRLTFSEAMGIEDFPPFLEISPEPGELVLNWDLEGLSVRIDHALFTPNTTYHVKLDRYLVSAGGNALWRGEDLVWNFTTGVEQGAWDLEGKTIVVGSDRTTYINATGRPDQDVFVIITGIGSYRLNETNPGVYTSIVPETALAWDTEYAYHFSDRVNGQDLAPELGGRFRTPKQTSIGDDDDDDDDDEDDDGIGKYILPLCIVLGIVLLLVILALVLFLALRKKGTSKGWEE